MPLLPPTIGERLVRCGKRVTLWGIAPGAHVELFVNAMSRADKDVAGTGTTFELAVELEDTQVVTAQQSLGGELSEMSPGVTVGDVELPPPAPHLMPNIYRCAHCIYVDGMAPGSVVRLFGRRSRDDEEIEIAVGEVNRHGWACMSAKGLEGVSDIFGRVETCGQSSGASPTAALVATPPSLPPPILLEPIFGCVTAVDLRDLTRGARVEVEVNGGFVGSFCSCWTNVHLNLPVMLNVGEEVTVRQMMAKDDSMCTTVGDYNDPPAVVVAPDERIKPRIFEPVYAGSTRIRVQNQYDGATLSVLVDAADLGTASASEYEEVALPAALVAGQTVVVEQSLCGHTEGSEPVVVQPVPATIGTPRVRAPLFGCGVWVLVDGVSVNADVRVYQNGMPVGFAISSGTSVTLHVGPSLVDGAVITARQWLGGHPSAMSSPVTVATVATLPVPEIVAPVIVGSTSVRVAGVVVGATVEVLDGGALIGSADGTDGFVHVTLARPIAADSALSVRQWLCGSQSGAGGTSSEPIEEPRADGDQTASDPQVQNDGTLGLPATENGLGADVPLTGELVYPQTPGGDVDPSGAPYPLVIVAHGRHRASAPSLEGYRYLTQHWATLGIISHSVDLNAINSWPNRTDTDGDGVVDTLTTGLDARALVILDHIRILLQRSTTPGDPLFGMIDPNRIGLLGHSRGGEGVVQAQVRNWQRAPADRLGIVGVVPIAPTNIINPVFEGSRLFVIYGSTDADVDGFSDGVNPFKLYDRSAPPKSMIFIHNARHNGFNQVWVRPDEDNEVTLEGTISPAAHQAIAKAYVSAFFQSVFFGRTGYEPYLQGAARPPGLGGYQIHAQYQVTDRQVVDNFGDADAQASIGAEPTIDRDKNTLTGADGSVSYSDADVSVWFDAEMTTLSQNPHDGRGCSLSWSQAESYTTSLGTVSATSHDVVSLRMGQRFDLGASPGLNPEELSQDALVTLVTTTGESTLRVGAFSDLPYPHVRADGGVKAPLKTVRLPLSAFAAANPGISLTSVTAIRVDFGTTTRGAITIDDVELSA